MKPMDIRTAFQACVNSKRKRKSSEPGDLEKNKALRVADSHSREKDDDVVEVLDEDLDSPKDRNEVDEKKPQEERASLNTVAPNEDIPKCDTVHDKKPSQSNGDPYPLQDSDDSSDAEVMEISPSTSDLKVLSGTSEINASKSSSAESVSSSEDEEDVKDTSLPNANSSSENNKALSSENTPKRRKRMSPAEAKRKEELRTQMMKEKKLKVAANIEKKNRLKEKREEERQLRKEKKEKERLEKLKLKQEKKEQEELRRQKEKEEKQKEKEERLKEKIRLKQELKAEEKKKKEEQKMKALDEKKKAEEEKIKAEEEKKRLQIEKEKKKKEAFQNFFMKSGFSITSPQAPPKEEVFRPFEVTKDMVLAPIIPLAAEERFNKDELDKCLQTQDCKRLYLDLLKSGCYRSITHKKEQKKKETDEDVMIIVNDSEVSDLHLKGKLYQFCENIRPAYWGTWRKKSSSVGPRRPFGKDSIFDYEVESDEEWDEGGPGESLTGTEDEESEDDYEVDNEFFVPHGYLSAEEEGDDEEDDDDAPTDPEVLKARLKFKEREFLSERKKKTVELQPVILGCFFEADDSPDIVKMESILLPHSAEVLIDIDFFSVLNGVKPQPSDDVDLESGEKTSPTVDLRHQNTGKKQPVPEKAMPYLIRLVHANTNSSSFLAKEFRAFWLNHCGKDVTVSEMDVEENQTRSSDNEQAADCDGPAEPSAVKNSINNRISLSQLHVTIRHICDWGKSPDPKVSRLCWWVKEDVRKKYGLMTLPVPNEWKYRSWKEDSLSSSQTC